MTAPDISASEALQLKDIHLPLSPEQWPPAPGWWLLLITAVALTIWISLWLFRRWRHHRLQKEILASLDELQRENNDQPMPQFLAELSILLRRVAMMNYPPQQVAGLTGNSWLAFLDQHGGKGEYANGVGRVLAAGPYANTAANDTEFDKAALLSLSRKWIKQNVH